MQKFLSLFPQPPPDNRHGVYAGAGTGIEFDIALGVVSDMGRKELFAIFADETGIIHQSLMPLNNTINEDRKWTILSSEYLVRRPWLTARRDVARLPDGRVNPEYYVLEYPDWVNIIALTEDGKMIMERQYRHALGNTCYELPCGVIEEGETPLEAAKRELLEETGYAGGQWQEWMELSPNPATCNNMVHSFLATGVKKVSSQHLDATEDIEVSLHSPEFVRELLVDNQILQALMAAPLWKYFYGK